MTSRNRTFLTLAVVAMASLAITAIPAPAATISALAISSTAPNDFQWPTAPLLADNEGYSTTIGRSNNGIKSDRDQAQTFTVTADGTIDLIAISVGEVNTAGTTEFTFNFFKVATVSSNIPVGAIIDTVTVTGTMAANAGFVTGELATMVFDVTNTPVLKDDIFAIQFDTVNTASHIAALRKDVASSYPDGQDVGKVSPGNSNDYHFAVYAVPEPATMSLLAIGGLGVMLKRRRRRA